MGSGNYIANRAGCLLLSNKNLPALRLVCRISLVITSMSTRTEKEFYDYLQDTLAITIDQAFEQFGVPKDAWRQIDQA